MHDDEQAQSSRCAPLLPAPISAGGSDVVKCQTMLICGSVVGDRAAETNFGCVRATALGALRLAQAPRVPIIQSWLASILIFRQMHGLVSDLTCCLTRFSQHYSSIAMHLMYTEDPTTGKRIYTLKKVLDGVVTKSAHPARFSPDDKYSR